MRQTTGMQGPVAETTAAANVAWCKMCIRDRSDVANQDGRTVLYVSHNMSTSRQLCTRCVVLDKGKERERGYLHVMTPCIGTVNLYKTSGH